MNYRHIYHAGNFADVIKHISLITILNQLKKKDKPFAVLDAFAGLGIYDLSSEQATKTTESLYGINKILTSPSQNTLIKQFVDIVQSAGPGVINSQINRTNNNEHLYYPGSPWIIQNLLREKDRLIATELHPQDYANLKYLFHRTENSAIHHLDAYNAIKAFVPFKENRGLILLDPPFEDKNEFNKLIESLKIIRHRAGETCTMIWYPIKEEKIANDFYQKSQSVGFKEILKIEFELKSAPTGLTKCGVLIFNPPFIHQELVETVAYIKSTIYQNEANYLVENLCS
jgi:23S rRNA (adenine2030-N6)-methyltransferase